MAFYAKFLSHSGPLPGDCILPGREAMVELRGSGHEVFLKSENIKMGKGNPRKHEGFQLTFEYCKVVPMLYSACCQGEIIPTVIIESWEVDETGQEKFVHRFILSHTKVTAISSSFLNTKMNPDEPFYITVTFMYESILWHCDEGFLFFEDGWEGSKELKAKHAEQIKLESQSLTETAPVEEDKPRLLDASWRIVDEQNGEQTKIEEINPGNQAFARVNAQGLSPGDLINLQFVEMPAGKALATKAPALGRDKEGWNASATFLIPETANPESSYLFKSWSRKVPGSDSKPLGSTLLKIVPAKAVNFSEVHAALFSNDCALPNVGKENELSDFIFVSWEYFSANPNKVAIVYGHTDTKGDSGYNVELSHFRAQTVQALLEQDPDLWCDTGAKKNHLAPAQSFLKLFAEKFSLSDPGSIDGKDGPKTQASVKSFQNWYNEKYQSNLVADGIIGPKTWRGIFRVYQELLAEAWKAKNSDKAIPHLCYGTGGGGAPDGTYGCGEAFPREKTGDEKDSAENRRVEVHFYVKGEEPKLAPMDTKRKAKVSKKEAPGFDKGKYKKTPIKAQTVQVEKEKVKGVMQYGVFFDGTGNHKDEDVKKTEDGIFSDRESNIARLWSIYPQVKENLQFKHYLEGVGTTSENFKENKIYGLATGKGAKDRIKTAYNHLTKTLRENPCEKVILDVFGFSRGAAEARDFINKLYEWKVTGLGGKPIPFEIRFLGIFDTVGSMMPGKAKVLVGMAGIAASLIPLFGRYLGEKAIEMVDETPDDADFDFNVYQARVKSVAHFISIYECRSDFDLRSIRQLSDPNSTVKPDILKPTHPLPPNWVEWSFAGVHSDVGGGYGTKLVYKQKNVGATRTVNSEFWIQELAKVPLHAMMKLAIKNGVPFLFQDESSIKNSFSVPPQLNKQYELCLNPAGYHKLIDPTSSYYEENVKPYIHENKNGLYFYDAFQTDREVVFEGAYKK